SRVRPRMPTSPAEGPHLPSAQMPATRAGPTRSGVRDRRTYRRLRPSPARMQQEAAMDKTEKSLPTLFSDLTRETLDLMRQEIALARAEVSEKISTAEKA